MLMIMPLAAYTLGKPSVTEPHPNPILNFIVKGCRAQPFTATHTLNILLVVNGNAGEIIGGL